MLHNLMAPSPKYAQNIAFTIKAHYSAMKKSTFLNFDLDARVNRLIRAMI